MWHMVSSRKVRTVSYTPHLNKMCITKCIQSMHDRKHVSNTRQPLRLSYYLGLHYHLWHYRLITHNIRFIHFNPEDKKNKIVA